LFAIFSIQFSLSSSVDYILPLCVSSILSNSIIPFLDFFKLLLLFSTKGVENKDISKSFVFLIRGYKNRMKISIAKNPLIALTSLPLHIRQIVGRYPLLTPLPLQEEHVC